MRSRVVIGALAAFAVLAAILWIPWATEKRAIVASTPVPPPVFGITPVPVKAGSTACLQNVTFYSRTRIGELSVTNTRGGGSPLAITATAPGYRSTARVPGGYDPDGAIRFGLARPSKSVLGQLCIRNAGRRTVNLVATNELRTLGRPTLVVDGAAQPVDAKLVFFDDVRQSYAGRIGEILGHAANFLPSFLPRGVLFLLGLLALVGIPIAMTAALVSSARADEQRVD
jgi:hypothetical protein